MSNTLSSMIKEGYNHGVSLVMQQRGSKLSSCVLQELQEDERCYYDQIKSTEAQDVIGIHSDTKIIPTEVQRRVVTLIRSDWADLIDNQARVHNLSDPTSSYVLNAAYSLGRRKDKHIIDAMLGTSYTGSKGQSIVELPKSQIIESSFGNLDNKKTGLTVDKLRKARQILDESNIDDDEEQFCIVTSKQIANLLESEKVTSSNYNSVQALVDGKIHTFMGFTFKKVDSKLLPKEKDERKIICFTKSAVLMGLKDDINTEISTRSDKRMAVQVYASMMCGATRMDEQKVVQINCVE